MRNLWIVIAAALLLARQAAPATAAVGIDSVLSMPAASDHRGTFTVMSWNIHHGVDEAGRPSLDRIARAIRTVDPDVVFLAEVDENWRRSGFARQAEALAAMTGMQALYFEPALTTRSPLVTRLGETARYGNAFLSRVPIVGRGAFPLPTSPGIEPRNLLFVDVRMGAERVRIFGTHLSVEGRERARQLAELGRILSKYSGPALLVGDLNASLAALEEAFPLLSGMDWEDALAGAGPEAGTFPASQPRARIDHILFSPQMRERLMEAFILDDTSSDHLAVVARFWIP